ncbi:GTPase HflX [bacterium]|nr:GTPase HflX [bacterium]
MHLSAPLKARQSADGPAEPAPENGNAAIIAELSRRYAAGADAKIATYDFIELAVAAGLRVSHTLEFTVKRIRPDYYLGSGQVDEICEHARGIGVELVVINAPLSPVHQRNWAERLKMPVLSRYDLIFAIFDQNARTAEGQLQVEMARLRYELPRIVSSYEALDPLAGGIGTLGPGEQLTERIKRRHRRRIYDIEQKLEKLRQQRALRRQRRSKSGIFIASLVGYTNVGKSTLLNRLTGSGVLVADQYFATLDPTARSLRLPDGGKILLTDTVGFLDDLPPELVESFRATLEEMEGASLLIHLADASHGRVGMQIDSVRKIIGEIGLAETDELLVFNKTDRADAETRAELEQAYPEALFVSAKTGEGLRDLLARLMEKHAKSGKVYDPE